MKSIEMNNPIQSRSRRWLRPLSLTLAALMLTAGLSACRGSNPPASTSPGGAAPAATKPVATKPQETPAKSDCYHTIEVDGKVYYVMDKAFDGEMNLQMVDFLHEDYTEEPDPGRVLISLGDEPVPEDFRQKTVMDKTAYQAYCEKFGLTPAFPDHDGSYAVLGCVGEMMNVVSVQVADATIEGDTLRLLVRDEFHNPFWGMSAGFVVTVPVPSSVTKLETPRLFNAKEEENLKKYGTPYDPNEEPMTEKPVIYLYPEEKTEVSVKLDYDGRLTCTYPAYQNGWTVTAEPDGTLTDLSGKTYSYLYWEGADDIAWDFREGFCVRGADTVAFLEDALEKLGLNRREANEFIIYWLPRMEGNAWNLISFQGQTYTDAARLGVSPAPDTVIRVFMAWEGLDAPVELRPQILSAPARSGFTVVEWGGTEVN